MLRKIISVLFSVILALTCISPCCFAAVDKPLDEMMPMYTHIGNIRCILTVTGSTAQCAAMANSRYSDTTTQLVVTLYRRASGYSTWSYVDSWQITQSGQATAKVDEDKVVSSGYDYRLLAVCKIKNATGAIQETGSLYSDIVSVP